MRYNEKRILNSIGQCVYIRSIWNIYGRPTNFGGEKDNADNKTCAACTLSGVLFAVTLLSLNNYFNPKDMDEMVSIISFFVSELGCVA